MSGWSQALRDNLRQQGIGLEEALQLPNDNNPEMFEQRIGEFLSFQSQIGHVGRFLDLGLTQQAWASGRPTEWVKDWTYAAEFRADQIVKALRKTLYELFGGNAIDPLAATQAYGALLTFLRTGNPRVQVTFATTNYDHAIEYGLEGNRLFPNNGARSLGHSQVLRPSGILRRTQNDDDGVAVLHLHGAIGWWRRDDGEIEVADDRAGYRDDLTPVVLMPDPNKNPRANPETTDLWQEFYGALAQATHVIVLGHSLHDAPIVDAIGSAGRKTAVLLYDDARWSTERDRVTQLLPHAEIGRVNFGPSPQFVWPNGFL